MQQRRAAAGPEWGGGACLIQFPDLGHFGLPDAEGWGLVWIGAAPGALCKAPWSIS